MSTASIIQEARVDAAQMEWERWKRANGVAAAGLRANADDIRQLAKRQSETRDERDLERDLERMAQSLVELAEHLDGETWLKSPKAMAAQRAMENGARDR